MWPYYSGARYRHTKSCLTEARNSQYNALNVNLVQNALTVLLDESFTLLECSSPEIVLLGAEEYGGAVGGLCSCTSGF